MTKLAAGLWILAVAVMTGTSTHGQVPDQKSADIPEDTQLTLDAAPALQRMVLPSILYIECKKTGKKGTAFIIAGGDVVTAAHVVCSCDAADIAAKTIRGEAVEFQRIARDEDLDLAVLRPKVSLRDGLDLAASKNAAMGERVNTWGFPLIYNGPAPLLSVGYVSGYYKAREQNFCDKAQSLQSRQFEHVVVNGAFNPGNSGGPLFVFGQNKVIGVVIWKEIAFSKDVQAAIDGFHHPSMSTFGTFNETKPDGTSKRISDQEAIARVLEEFYNKVQVNIGEAVSVSELRNFLKQHASELHGLPVPAQQPVGESTQ